MPAFVPLSCLCLGFCVRNSYFLLPRITVELKYLRVSSKLNDKLPWVTVLSARCQNQMRKTLIDAKIVCAPQVHVHNFINYLAVFFNTSHSNNVDILHIQNMNSKIFVTKNSFMDLLFNSVAGVLCRCGIVPNVGIYYLLSTLLELGTRRPSHHYLLCFENVSITDL